MLPRLAGVGPDTQAKRSTCRPVCLTTRHLTAASLSHPLPHHLVPSAPPPSPPLWPPTLSWGRWQPFLPPRLCHQSRSRSSAVPDGSWGLPLALSHLHGTRRLHLNETDARAPPTTLCPSCAPLTKELWPKVLGSLTNPLPLTHIQPISRPGHAVW